MIRSGGYFGILDHGRRQVGAGVEQVVLDLASTSAICSSGLPKRDRDADGGVGLVAVRVRRQPRRRSSTPV